MERALPSEVVGRLGSRQRVSPACGVRRGRTPADNAGAQRTRRTAEAAEGYGSDAVNASASGWRAATDDPEHGETPMNDA